LRYLKAIEGASQRLKSADFEHIASLNNEQKVPPKSGEKHAKKVARNKLFELPFSPHQHLTLQSLDADFSGNLNQPLLPTRASHSTRCRHGLRRGQKNPPPLRSEFQPSWMVSLRGDTKKFEPNTLPRVGFFHEKCARHVINNHFTLIAHNIARSETYAN
jgi:hypothetical protein